MKAIKYIFILIMLFIRGQCLANDSLQINEIMYDPSGSDSNREWIEVQNNSSETLDISKWYFFTDNTKHSITSPSFFLVPPNAYAVIAQSPEKFKIDYPSYSGLLFDSSWTSLTNAGETIALKDPNLNLTSSITFSSGAGGSGDGYSLQKINTLWVGSKPTPGEVNKESPKIVKEEKVSTTSASGSASKSKSKKKSTNFKSETSDSVINLDTLPASAGSDAVTISKSSLAWFGLGGLVILSSLIMIILRSRNSKKSGENDITADDMTIIE